MAVRQCCIHRAASLQELDDMLKEYNMKRDSVEINHDAPQWSHHAVWNRQYMEPKPGYTLEQLWTDSEPAISKKTSTSYEIQTNDVLRAVAATATGATGCGIGGGGSPLSAGFIIWAMSECFCFSRRIRVISRVNAAGSSTSAFASASGLSTTMAMSISPPSLWIMVGRPACTSARIATALFTHSAFPFLQGSLR